jgi:hypothetical protein
VKSDLPYPDFATPYFAIIRLGSDFSWKICHLAYVCNPKQAKIRQSYMMSELQITKNERDLGTIESDRLMLAVNQIHTTGYLVVRDVLREADLDKVEHVLTDAWKDFQTSKPAWRGGGKIVGHLGIVPPKQPQIINTDVLCNPIVWSIVSALMDGDVFLTGIGGNINLPGSRDQSFHSDLTEPDPKSLLINIPIGDVDENNGSIELISGSHLPDQNRTPDPIRINTKSGSVLIRYPHLLHRGKQNCSPNPRYMLGLWAKCLTNQQRKREDLCLDPNTPSLLEDCVEQFNDLGLGGEQPVFMPNYFAPTLLGLLKELIYCHAPTFYRFLAERY